MLYALIIKPQGEGDTEGPGFLSMEGLWLSLVLPVGRERDVWGTLPLAMGWAIVKVIKDLGAHEVRLRWSNDIMVRNMKLAGLILKTTEDVHRQMEKNGFTAILEEIDAACGWGSPRQAELELDEGIRREFFIGVNEYGELITKNDSGHVCYYPPFRVKLFREI